MRRSRLVQWGTEHLPALPPSELAELIETLEEADRMAESGRALAGYELLCRRLDRIISAPRGEGQVDSNLVRWWTKAADAFVQDYLRPRDPTEPR